TLTPSASIEATGNLITLDNTGYTDAAGNTGVGSTASNSYAIDTLLPNVNSVSVPANGTYVAGDTLDFVVNFNEAVTVSGNPRLLVQLDSGDVYAEYLSGSGSSALVFRLIISDGQLDSDGLQLGNSIDLNGATLRDAAGNDAELPLNSVADTSGVQVDAVPPEVSSITLDNPSPTNANSVSFTVTFSEAVNGVELGDFQLLTSGSAVGNPSALSQIDAQTWQVTVTGVTGVGSLGLVINAAGSGISDNYGNMMTADASAAGYEIIAMNHVPIPDSGPSPTPTITPPPSPPELPPNSGGFWPLPPSLFPDPMLGSGIGSIKSPFIEPNPMQISLLAQIFSQSSGGGFLGFGGGDAGIFGRSSLAQTFDLQRSLFNRLLERSGGAASLQQQLERLNSANTQHIEQLGTALKGMSAHTQQS
ncbi:MAG: Ig-like domain-containing protein, partial [Pseudomonadaceae bacterium]